MDVDLEVLCTTINDYGQAIEDLTDIKDKVQNTNTTLADKGWTGEAQKKYNELLKWFLSKDYELLMENLKCVKTILYNEAKYPGGGLKDRCEDFVNCLDGSEKGFYSEESGASSGVLSLEYDNTNSVISYVEDVLDDLIPKKKKILNELESTIHGGWFSSGLIYCSFSIDNELAESSNQIKKEETGLTAFLESFAAYTNGVKSLESRVSGGLSEVKDLEQTAVSDKSLSSMDISAHMTTVEKIETAGKTVVVDVGVGVITTVTGGFVLVGSAVAAPPTLFASTATMPEGIAMVVSGGNSTYNGLQDIKRELDGDWGEVGSTNLVKDTFTNMATKVTGSGNAGNIIGSGVMLVIDGGASARGLRDGVKDTLQIGKDAFSAGKTTFNNYQALGTSYNVINTVSGTSKIVKVVNVDAEALKNAASKVGMPAYNDVTSYYNGLTVKGDFTSIFQNQEVSEIQSGQKVTGWIES